MINLLLKWLEPSVQLDQNNFSKKLAEVFSEGKFNLELMVISIFFNFLLEFLGIFRDPFYI